MHEPLRVRAPIGFAHRGARAHAPENTLAAFSLALEMGATALESDVWLTADGVAVLDHDGVFDGSPVAGGTAADRLPRNHGFDCSSGVARCLRHE